MEIVTISAEAIRRSARGRGRQNSETCMVPPMCTPRARSPGVQHDPCRGESHRVLVPFPRCESIDQLTRTELDPERRHVSQQHLTHGTGSGLCQLEASQPSRLGGILRPQNLPGFEQR